MLESQKRHFEGTLEEDRLVFFMIVEHEFTR